MQHVLKLVLIFFILYNAAIPIISKYNVDSEVIKNIKPTPLYMLSAFSECSFQPHLADVQAPS